MTDGKTSLNLELLIKLLKLTTSSNDGEALLASRKANEVLGKFGGDWEALLRGKVTVIADPFAVAAPPHKAAEAPPAPRAPAQRSHAPPQNQFTTPQPPPKFKPAQQNWSAMDAAQRAASVAQTQAAAKAAAQTQTAKAQTRNTLRKQRVQLDDLA